MRYIAEFVPQAWINDHAITVDPEGEGTWDVTDHLESLDPAARSAALRDNSDASDGLRELDNAPDWVKHWQGPFYVTVRSEPKHQDTTLANTMEPAA